MNYLSLYRTQLLAIATVLLLVSVVIYHIWADWGLVTVHSKGQPLAKVIASIERQGHAKIQTDLPVDTAVTMDVEKVPVADALETLATVTESRWRLLYFVAGDNATLKSGEQSWFGGQRPDDWTMLSFPMFTGNMVSGGDSDIIFDPRQDVWNPKTAAPATVQDFFKEAAQATNASFAFPKSWNPTVKSTPPSGVIERVLPKLISAAGGHEDQLFFLSKPGRRGPRPEGNDGPTMTGDLRPDFDLLAARVQQQINRMPPEERSDAQANFNSQQAFFKSLAGMTDDQRRQAFQQHMQDPQVQDQMLNRMDSREAHMNHDQRMNRMQNYVNRKLAATGKL